MTVEWEPVQMTWLEDPVAKDRRTTVNDHEYFPGQNDLEIPDLEATDYVPDALAPWHHRREYPGKAVHFFLDDYRFESVWRNPAATVERLRAADAVLTPDFSTWSEMPWPVALWQIYRSRWMGAFWRSRGLRVVPHATWGIPAQPWHFTGLPMRSTIAIQCQATAKQEGMREADADSIRLMIDHLEPTTILSYGPFPDGIALPSGLRVVQYPTFAAERLHVLDAKKAALAREAANG